ncbi:hypothetical protein GCM10019059_34800 [Camelimonas fluminis]|uniref:ArsR family transcriptional regulator n=1 Tax=Camelimonas fluminis TaxID=1576911 RepID=A0ABV7UG98_9HYPH|nr:hypothetical protein [Camelimonas fluminis]GHE72232.1 hypothetical protein GCM10019059_34800 [Camelimonas fluminis]
MSFAALIEEEARLIILRTLADQPDNRLNSSLLRDDLANRWAINKQRDWVHLQLDWLAEMGAVKATRIETVVIAELTTRGLDHVERRTVIPGVKKPSPAAV